MDWIERLFGFAPDNGDGTIEVFLVLVATICVAVAVGRHPRARQMLRNFIARRRASTPK